MEETYSSTAFFAWLFLGLALLIPLALWLRDLKRRADNARQIRRREEKRKQTQAALSAKTAEKRR